jgi:hypothetical protein
MKKRWAAITGAVLTALLAVAITLTLVARQEGWLQFGRNAIPDACLTGQWQVFDPGDRRQDKALNGDLISVSALSSNDVWAVGSGANPLLGGRFITEVAHWDGTRMRIVPSPSPDPQGNYLVSVAAVSESNVWAVGYTDHGALTEQWNGSRWSVVPTPLTSDGDQLRAISADSPSDVWAVGSMVIGSGAVFAGRIPAILHWNGSAWALVQGATPGDSLSGDRPYSALYAVTAVAPDDVWATGDEMAGQTPALQRPIVERWDGATWHAEPAPYTSHRAVIVGLSATKQVVWITAWSDQLPTTPSEPSPVVAMRWNGAGWDAAPPPPPDLKNIVMRPGTAQVWLTGTYGPNLAARLNGYTWTKPLTKPALKQVNWLPGDEGYATPAAISSNGDLWLAGSYLWKRPYPPGSTNSFLEGGYPALMRYHFACSS